MISPSWLSRESTTLVSGSEQNGHFTGRGVPESERGGQVRGTIGPNAEHACAFSGRRRDRLRRVSHPGAGRPLSGTRCRAMGAEMSFELRPVLLAISAFLAIEARASGG